jgi:CBS domain containing-hemolysin-like protein
MEVVVILCLLGLSFLFSGSEVAFFSLTPYHLEKKGRGRLKGLIRGLLSDPNGLLSLILLGNTAANMYSSALFAVLLMGVYRRLQVGEPVATLSNVILYTLLLLLFGEILPKFIALNRPLRFSSVSAVILVPLRFLLLPIVFPLSSLLRRLSGKLKVAEVERNVVQEVELQVDSAVTHGDMEPAEAELVMEGLTFIRGTVKDIMTSRTELEVLSADSPVEEAAKLAMRSRHSRFPVYLGALDNVVGVLEIPALIRAGAVGGGDPLSTYARKPYFVPETMRLRDLQGVFQREGGYVVVVDEYGGTAGVVTEGDLAKGFTAEVLEDFESRAPVGVKEVEEGVFLLDGDTEIRELEALTGVSFESEGTVAGLILETMGIVPDEGEGVEVRSVRFEVVAKEGERIDRVKVTVNR